MYTIACKMGGTIMYTTKLCTSPMAKRKSK